MDEEINWTAVIGRDRWKQAIFRMYPKDTDKKEDNIGQKELPTLKLAHEQIIDGMTISMIADSYPLLENMIAIEKLSGQLYKDRHCILQAEYSVESKSSHDDPILSYKAMSLWKDFIPCIQMISPLLLQYGNHEFSPYVNEFIKRFSKYVINPDDPEERSRKLDSVTAQNKCSELYHDIQRFHYRLNSQVIVKAMKNKIKAADKNLQRMQSLIDSLLRQHHQSDMLCIELGYMPKYLPRVTFNRADQDRKALLKYLDQWPHLGYVWHLEQSSGRGFQYQLVVFLDTQNETNVLAVAAALGEFWRKLDGLVKTKIVDKPTVDAPKTKEKNILNTDHSHDVRRYIIYEIARQKYNHQKWPSLFFCGRISSETKGKLDDLCFQMTMPAYLLSWNPNYAEEMRQDMSIEKEVFQDTESTDNAHQIRSEEEYIKDEARYADVLLAKQNESKKSLTKSKKNRTFQTSVFPRGKSRNLLKKFNLGLSKIKSKTRSNQQSELLI